MIELVIGDKNLSSWSLRPWLVLKQTGQPFTETVVRLNRPDTGPEIMKHSPTGQVPALRDGELALWDSLAISEYLAERFPGAGLWPQDPLTRAHARAVACEMHSGFASLRGECPMNLTLTPHRKEVSDLTRRGLVRLVQMFSEMRARFGGEGPWMFGRWSIADAFYTPVATRIRTYGLALSDFGDTGVAGEYVSALLQQPDFLEWEQQAAREEGGSPA